jgi:hypothetical protein
MLDAIKYTKISRKWVNLKFERGSGVDLLVVTPNQFMRDAIGVPPQHKGVFDFEYEKFESIDAAAAFVKGIDIAMEISGFRIIGYIDTSTNTQNFRLMRNR